MSVGFESLVGYLYVVGGRSISTIPPGALVTAAPKKAARGRETDTFFAMVLPTSKHIVSPSFYEHLAQLAAERYFAGGGSVTSALRDVFNTLNYDLVEHNRSGENRHEASILCAVLRGGDLIVGRVGSAAACVLANGQIKTFPADLSDRESLQLPALGVLPMPDIKMTQFQVKEGTRVILGDANIAAFGADKIHNVLMSVDVGAVLVGFKDLARLQAALMLVEFVPPGAPSSPIIPEGHSTTEVAARLRGSTGNTSDTQTTQEASRQKPPRRKSGEKVRRRVKRGAGRVALVVSDILRLLEKITGAFRITRRAPAQDGTKRSGWIASPVGTGMVFLLPVAVVALVVLLWISNTGESEFEVCMQEVRSRVELARSPSVVNNDRRTILDAWNVTLGKVDECIALRPTDPELAAIQAEGLRILDNLNQISRRETRVIDTLPGATLTRIVAQGQNLYVFDEANGQVYQITLSSDGLSRTRLGVPIPAMRTGGRAGGIPVGQIFDIAYNEDANMIVAIDRDGVLVECSPQFLQCTGQRLLKDDWVNPVAFTTWNRRIYVLDTGVGDGQIWRYEPSGGSYSIAPTEYFSGSSMPVLRTGIDFDIDDNGNVYVLLAEGIILKYRGGGPQAFAFSTFPNGDSIVGPVSMYLDDRPTAQNIYIADRYRRAIYETSLVGRFRNSFHVYDQALFDLLSGVAVMPGVAGEELLYAVSGNAVLVLTSE